MTLEYHQGQIEVQTEANTRPVADMLAGWVGPVGEFCRTADMVVFAVPRDKGRFEFMAVSGPAPIIEIADASTILVRLDPGEGPDLNRELPCGGVAINPAVARRARLNGSLRTTADGLVLEAGEMFTNCRKYIAPSLARDAGRHFGPVSREPIPLDDAYVARVLSNAETSFLASASPDGAIDVSHRGGPPGFLRLAPFGRRLEWDEYVGDGMLKSAGNIRATGRMALLVPDLATGDAVELIARAEVKVHMRTRRPRTDALLQHREEFPVQGLMTCQVEAAYHLTGLIQPRHRIEKHLRVTSASSVHEQAPQ